MTAPAPETPPSSGPAFAVLNEVGIISQLSGAKLEALLPHRMTLAQFRVLNRFMRMGGAPNINRLAQAFQVSKPTMGGVVESLRRKDLVTLEADPEDRRSKIVSITDKGRAAHALSISLIAPELARIEQALGAATLAALVPELQRLRRYLDDNR